jgi:hypothetical protein
MKTAISLRHFLARLLIGQFRFFDGQSADAKVMAPLSDFNQFKMQRVILKIIIVF